MHLYDTASRAVRPLTLNGPVSLYVCGITPYDSAHLGHAFTYHAFDVLTRRLVAAGSPVRSVRNITDVDDDIFRASRERGEPVPAMVAREVARFDQGMAALGILPVLAAPKASEHVPEMAGWVARLEAAGFAYAQDGRVYFDTRRFRRYGRLSRLSRDEMIALSRERGADPDDERKRDPLDFVLWQPSLPDEPRWPSRWGDGRPGWHIECSVLASHYLGLPVDIHGGGDDLIYPHHESEIAQAEVIQEEVFARHWMHVAMVALDGVKMSKSLGNLVFVHTLLESTPAPAVRVLLNAHHYRTAWSYEAEELREAAARHRAYIGAAASGGVLEREAATEIEGAFLAALDNDLDTPSALRVLDATAAAVTRAAPDRAAPSDGVDGAGLISRLAGIIGVEAVAA